MKTTTTRRPYLGQECEIIEVATTSTGRTLHGLKLSGATGCFETSWDTAEPLIALVREFRLRLRAI